MICDAVDNDDDEVGDDKDEKDGGDDGGGDDGAPDGQGYPLGVHELSWTSLREPWGQDDKTKRQET